MALDRNTAQHQVDLVVAVPKALQVLDDAQAGLAVRDRGVHVVLLAVLVDAEALKVDHAPRAELRLHGSRDVDGRFAAHHAQLGLAVLDHLEFDRDDARDFDRAAEGDFTVALCLGSKGGGWLVSWVGSLRGFMWIYDIYRIGKGDGDRIGQGNGLLWREVWMDIREKCRSPTENFAPLTWTGR